MNRDESYLFDIAKFCRTILRLTENMTEADFEQDERTQLAVLYEITIIGEVVKRLSPEFRDRHGTIEWRQIAGMRDRSPSQVETAYGLTRSAMTHIYFELQGHEYSAFHQVLTDEVWNLYTGQGI